MKNRTEDEFLRTYKEKYAELTNKGYPPKFHKTDSKCSKAIETFIDTKNTQLQFSPPAINGQNAAEQAVRTWKNHFITGIASLPKEFPISNRCRLILQCNTTLNLMRPCRQKISLSAHTALHGDFHFDATPLVPPCTKIMVHNKSQTRKSWDFHAFDALYVGLSMKHYQCYKLVSKKTGVESTPDTVQFNHHIV